MKRNWNFMMESPLSDEEIADREAEIGDAKRDLERDRECWEREEARQP